MQKIDFHAHVFPDALAAKAIPALAAAAQIEPQGDGTLGGLRAAMQRDAVVAAAALGIAVTPRQTEKVNAFAETLAAEENLFSFGSVHPETPEVQQVLQGFAARGLRGVKLHPEYQRVRLSDAAFAPILEAAAALDLPVLVHAGWDFAYPDSLLCTVDDLAAVLRDHPRLKLIAAHMGGFRCWDEVEQKLAGKEVWIDTSMSAGYIDPAQAARILRRHDPERILFGSDWPWHTAAAEERFLLSLGLNDALLEKIFLRNAKALMR